MCVRIYTVHIVEVVGEDDIKLRIDFLSHPRPLLYIVSRRIKNRKIKRYTHRTCIVIIELKIDVKKSWKMK